MPSLWSAGLAICLDFVRSCAVCSASWLPPVWLLGICWRDYFRGDQFFIILFKFDLAYSSGCDRFSRFFGRCCFDSITWTRPLVRALQRLMLHFWGSREAVLLAMRLRAFWLWNGRYHDRWTLASSPRTELLLASLARDISSSHCAKNIYMHPCMNSGKQ